MSQIRYECSQCDKVSCNKQAADQHNRDMHGNCATVFPIRSRRDMLNAISKLETDLATCRKYRNAYAEMDRIATEALRKCEAERETASAETAARDEIIGSWLSAALDDTNAGEAFKADVQRWFDTSSTAALAARDKATREQALREAITAIKNTGDLRGSWAARVIDGLI